VTAYKIYRGFRTTKTSNLWRSTFLGSLMVAGLFIVLVPIPGLGDNDRDMHPGREDNDKGIRAEITALQETVSALQSQVNSLQTANTGLQNEIKTLRTQLAAV
jgi:hypothetical protein